MVEVPSSETYLSDVASAFSEEVARLRDRYPDLQTELLYREALATALSKTESIVFSQHFGVHYLFSNHRRGHQVPDENDKPDQEPDEFLESLKHIPLGKISVAEAARLRKLQDDELDREFERVQREIGFRLG